MIIVGAKMGIFDIVYAEIKDLLSKQEKKKEMKKEINHLIKKTLKRFIIDWDQFIASQPVNFYEETTMLYSDYREAFVELYVEFEDTIDESTKEKLMKITDLLQKGKNTIPAMGMGAYNERKKYGDESVLIAKNIIENIGDSND